MKTLCLLLALLIPALARADDDDGLQNPGKVEAVQNREFRLDHELSLGVGVLPLDAFYKGLTVQVGYTFHFSDSFAWQVGRALYSYDVKTGLEDQLERDFRVQPTTLQEVQWMVGSDLVWSPIYGKASFDNDSVHHFGAWLLVGGSVIKFRSTGSDGGTLQAFKPAVNFGLGVRLFQSRRVSYRLDLTDNVVISKQSIFNVPSLQLSVAFNFGSLE